MPNEDEPYVILSKTKVLALVLTLSFVNVLFGIAANLYVPSLEVVRRVSPRGRMRYVPNKRKDLHVSVEAINLSITVNFLAQALSPTIFGSLADVWGRRPIYVPVLVLFTIACVGVALTPYYWLLLVFRVIHGISMSTTVTVAIFVPETLRSLVGNGSGYANPSLYQWWTRRGTVEENVATCRPLKLSDFTAPFRLLLEPDVLVSLIFNGLHYSTIIFYSVMNSHLFATQYGLSTLQIGLTQLSSAIGSISMLLVHGKLLDRDYQLMKKKNLPDAEFPIHWARLRSVWVLALLVQIILVVYGWCAQIHVPLPVLLTLLFISKRAK
ncbi:hypothetical protein EC973_007533 [Apophysomyces ossiformis]|uniref:Major facilitator superfamily (MFS) profile domain-containing protein n=1 Tax=Apophysomyces ossiformis TaxID=679940 RepID=A0A8H7BUM0_9FUNG|nr:hypothetical protein EC973_007533 [Apophysomyces ossiformis]